MSKKPSQPTVAPPPPTAARIDVGDLTEAVTKSITRALDVKDPARLPIRIIVGIIAEPPDFFRGGGGGSTQQ